MRLIVIVLSLLLTLSCNQFGRINNPVSRAKQGSVAIKILNTCLGPNGLFYRSGGSGASISAKYALTAQHVIDCPSGVQALIVERADGQQLVAEVDLESKNSDLARIKLVEGEFKSWITAIAQPPGVDDVVCFESALPGRSRKCGWVEKLTDRPNADIRHSAISEPGNSGSAMYNEEGALVGVVTMLYYCPNLLPTKQVCGGLASSIWKHRELFGG